MMGSREKTLLVVLLSIFAAWQGGSLLQRWLVSPMATSRSQLDSLETEIARYTTQQEQLHRAEQHLASAYGRSLPPDPLMGQRLYQQWLTDLAQNAGFSQTNVFPLQVANLTDQCGSVTVSIDAQATLAQMAWFLERFYEVDLLHQIQSLSMDSLSQQGDPVLRVTLVAEGLSLRGAPARRVLFPQATLNREVASTDNTMQVGGSDSFPTRGSFAVRLGGEYLEVTAAAGNTWSVTRGQLGSMAADHAAGDVLELVPRRSLSSPGSFGVQDLVGANPFAKPAPPVEPRAVADTASEPEIDLAQFTYLVGTVSQGDREEAWFYNRLDNKKIVAVTGEAFSIAGMDAKLLAVDGERIELLVEERLWRLKVGKSLKSVEQVAPAATAEDGSANSPP